MKRTLFAAAIVFGCFSAFAQVGQVSQVASDTQSTAAASNAGNNQQFNPTLMFNEAATNPFSSTEIRYSGSQSVKTVPNVVAPGLVATPATCLGSVSGGGSVLGFGGSAASTVADVPCNGREGAKLFHVMGMHDQAIERLCGVPEEAKAIEAGFLKARTRWVTSANEARAKGQPLPELRAQPRCMAAQQAEDTERAQAAISGRQVSTSTTVPPATLSASGTIPDRMARFGGYAVN